MSEPNRLRATFEAAMDFGLTDEEIWAAVLEVVDSTAPDKPAEQCLDEVAAILAARISEEG